MENSTLFGMLSRMKYVNRWGLMRNTRSESIAEHTMDVVFISHALAVIGNIYFGREIDAGRVALLAAFHDAPEIVTGDMPTPVKYFNPEIRSAYACVEDAAKESMAVSLPVEMQDTYRELLNGENEEIYRYVKAADKLSALIKCMEEEQTGNQDFRKAKEATLASIEDMHMPEVGFFMEHFAPSYQLTLDELIHS